ncbi:MAG: 1-deoxy-D-xylulose-5-phosphate synthase [Thermodesulfovibrionales bacterium]|nr:1-deoxy-D-xylulose-5-phosphate synthase [Thermodesulfovibrionales bacterium]
MLENINSPDDLKSLRIEDLEKLAKEIRDVIIERVSINGGHLASNLGVVELAIALHYVFKSPEDKIIWDVGHQSYPHKLLTGRYKDFHTLRKFKGISGFPKRSESPHDIFGTGHSSTSISAAAGIIEGRDLKNSKFNVIAVIGDGALTSGLAFEGLNYIGHVKKNLIVVLNDNEMAISANVGALSNYLSKILTSTFLKKFKRDTKAFIEGIPKIGESFAKLAAKAEGSIKSFFLPGGLFEDLGFNYVGPLDGHDLHLLIETFKNLKDSFEPIFLHVVTKKGKGYAYSEQDPSIYHGIGPFKVETGIGNITKKSINENDNLTTISYSELFGKTLTELAATNEKIIAITAAMKEGTGLSLFADKFPDRFFDVGIAEPHAVTFAAGLATEGFKPVVAIYSTFLQRAYDQIIHDVCLQKLPVIFAIDRGGIVGEDGATHQGIFDLSFLRVIPNLIIMSPKDGIELIAMLRFAIEQDRPVAIRYPRENVTFSIKGQSYPKIELGKAEVIKDGKDLAIIAIGSTVNPSFLVAKKCMENSIDIAVINARFIKPLDEKIIANLIEQGIKKIITIEENILAGGLGAAVLETLNDMQKNNLLVKRLGIKDSFIEHGSQHILRKELGLDVGGIYKEIIDFFHQKA